MCIRDRETLLLKTKDNLLTICSNLHIDIARSSRKDVIISAIMDRKDRSNYLLPPREKIELRAAGSLTTEVSSMRSTVMEERSNTTMQKHIAANIDKAIDGIESRLSNNLTACVSETKRQSTMLQEELVATKATLAAERQQKKEFKKEATETLNEHVEIFGKISEAATKPLMEVMRLFTQTNIAAIEKSANSNSVKTDLPQQPIVIPSTPPMVLHNHHHHQHHAVLPSSTYVPMPSIEQQMLYSHLNPQRVNIYFIYCRYLIIIH